MFIIDLKLTKDLAIVDKYVPAHREWLKSKYEQGLFLCSGPKIPRTGGIIITLIKDRQMVEAIIHEDPYYKNDVASYSLIEFDPLLHNDKIKGLLP